VKEGVRGNEGGGEFGEILYGNEFMKENHSKTLNQSLSTKQCYIFGSCIAGYCSTHTKLS